VAGGPGLNDFFQTALRVPPVPRSWGPGRPRTPCERIASVWPHRRCR
jgi:hypothetical protein